MDHAEVTTFLKKHQPLTDESLLEDPGLVDTVGEVISFYRSEPITDDLPLLFGFVGESDACGWFEDLAEVLVLKFNPPAVRAEVGKALAGAHVGRALWAAYLTWDLAPSEIMDICRAHYSEAPAPARGILAWAIERAAGASDLRWIDAVIRDETDPEARERLTATRAAVEDREFTYYVSPESVPWSLDSDGPFALTVGNDPESAVIRFNAEFRRTKLTGGDSESILPEDAFAADVPYQVRPVELTFNGLQSQRCVPKSSFGARIIERARQDLPKFAGAGFYKRSGPLPSWLSEDRGSSCFVLPFEHWIIEIVAAGWSWRLADTE